MGYAYWPSTFLPADSRCASEAATAEYWLLALKDGIIRAIMDYRVEDETLHYVRRDGAKSSVPLSEVNLEFTRQLNRERGVAFRLPKAEASQPTPESSSMDLISLRHIRTVCVEEMGGNLDDYIIAEINKKLAGRLSVRLSLQGADAVLLGDYAHRRVWPATVSLLDSQGEVVIWSSPIKPPGIWSGPRHARKMAKRVVKRLKRTIAKTERGN